MAERRSVAADVVGSKPTSRPKLLHYDYALRPTLLRVPPTPVPAPVPAPLLPGSSSAPANLYAGTSGWAYPTWKPEFYPPGTPAKQFLEFYASQLTSVEVNYTFRTVPTAKVIGSWLDATPEGFRFSFKAPQRITHFKRLRDCDDDLAQFLASLQPVRQAGRLGLLLFQLPPNFQADPGRLSAFLATHALRVPRAPHIAFEFRHESWFDEQIYVILRKHNAALCIAESDSLATPEVHTSVSHTCFRMRRNGGYTPPELKDFARHCYKLAGQRDVYVYFKHEDEPTGALNAAVFLDFAPSHAGSA